MSNSLLVPATEKQPEAGPVVEEKQLWSLPPATPISHAGTVSGSCGIWGQLSSVL